MCLWTSYQHNEDTVHRVCVDIRYAIQYRKLSSYIDLSTASMWHIDIKWIFGGHSKMRVGVYGKLFNETQI